MRTLFIVIISILLVGCTSQSAQAIQTPIAQTQSSNPTIQPSITDTPYPTNTPEPTATPTETLKPTLTVTPVNPAQELARSLGYDNYQECTLIRYQGVNTDSLLVSQGEGLLGYYSYESEKWNSTKGWKEALAEAKGDTWEDYFGLAYKDNRAFKAITDGEIIREPFQITTKDGEVLVTSEVSIRSFYLDAGGKLQSVIIPQLLRLADGRLFLPRGREVNWNEEEIDNQVKSAPSYFNGGIRGFVTWAELTPDMDNRLANEASLLPEVFRYYFSLIDKFIKSKADILEKFYETGDPSVNIIFPSSIGFGRPDDIVELP